MKSIQLPVGSREKLTTLTLQRPHWSRHCLQASSSFLLMSQPDPSERWTILELFRMDLQEFSLDMSAMYLVY